MIYNDGDSNPTAPTENTGDEGLREKLKEWAAETYRNISNSGMDWLSANDDMEKLLALIRQDRRELLERLKGQREIYELITHGAALAVPVKLIDAELQHLTTLDEGEA